VIFPFLSILPICPLVPSSIKTVASLISAPLNLVKNSILCSSVNSLIEVTLNSPSKFLYVSASVLLLVEFSSSTCLDLLICDSVEN